MVYLARALALAFPLVSIASCAHPAQVRRPDPADRWIGCYSLRARGRQYGGSFWWTFRLTGTPYRGPGSSVTPHARVARVLPRPEFHHYWTFSGDTVRVSTGLSVNWSFDLVLWRTGTEYAGTLEHSDDLVPRDSQWDVVAGRVPCTDAH